MQWCDRQISQHVRSCDAARRAARVIGIGELGASAFTASVADFHQFKSGRQFGAWLGIVPRQNSSGGKPSLGRITKRGDNYRTCSRGSQPPVDYGWPQQMSPSLKFRW